MDEHEARFQQTVALNSIAQSLAVLAANAPDTRAALVRISTSLEQMANDDPLSRVERALDRAGDVLGYDLAAPQPQTFDNRFAGRPLEEQVR